MDVAVYFPPEHEIQAASPTTSAYFPASQLEQLAEPEKLYLPMAQESHADMAFDPANFPPAQSMQEKAATPEYFPV